jgi:hypothetical protein
MVIAAAYDYTHRSFRAAREMSMRQGVGVVCLLAVGLASCAPIYDSITDGQITSITQEGDKLLVTLENDYSAGKYPAYDASSYNQVEGDLKALGNRLRNSGSSDTASVAPYAETALKIIKELQLRDAAGTLPSKPDDTYFSDKEYLFNLNMGLLTNYELLLKGGASTSSAAQSTAATAAKAK